MFSFRFGSSGLGPGITFQSPYYVQLTFFEYFDDELGTLCLLTQTAPFIVTKITGLVQTAEIWVGRIGHHAVYVMEANRGDNYELKAAIREFLRHEATNGTT